MITMVKTKYIVIEADKRVLIETGRDIPGLNMDKNVPFTISRSKPYRSAGTMGTSKFQYPVDKSNQLITNVMNTVASQLRQYHNGFEFEPEADGSRLESISFKTDDGVIDGIVNYQHGVDYEHAGKDAKVSVTINYKAPVLQKELYNMMTAIRVFI